MGIKAAVILLAASSWAAQSPLGAVEPVLDIYAHSQNYSFEPLLHLPGISPYFDVGRNLGIPVEYIANPECRLLVLDLSIQPHWVVR